MSEDRLRAVAANHRTAQKPVRTKIVPDIARNILCSFHRLGTPESFQESKTGRYPTFIGNIATICNHLYVLKIYGKAPRLC